MTEHFEFVVIGSGPAGQKAAAQAAYLGHRVPIVERSKTPEGFTVGNAGIPTKTLRETAEVDRYAAYGPQRLSGKVPS